MRRGALRAGLRERRSAREAELLLLDEQVAVVSRLARAERRRPWALCVELRQAQRNAAARQVRVRAPLAEAHVPRAELQPEEQTEARVAQQAEVLSLEQRVEVRLAAAATPAD